MLCSVPSRFFGQRINRVVGAKENTAPAPKRWMVFGSLGRNLSLCDGKSERIVPLTAQARKGLGAGLGAIPAPPPPREPETTRVPYSKKQENLSATASSSQQFSPKNYLPRNAKGLSLEGSSFVLIAHGENWRILLLVSLCNIIRRNSFDDEKPKTRSLTRAFVDNTKLETEQ